MKKQKLIINSNGLFISIPGIPPFRTPAKVDITKVGEKIVRAELRKNGITNYKITPSEEEPKSIPLQINKQEKSNTSIEDIKKSIDNMMILLQSVLDKEPKKVEQSTEKIESLLNEFLLSGKKVEKEFATAETKRRSKIDESVDDFIPEINIDKMSLKGGSSEKVIKSDRNILKNAESLKSLKGDK